MAIESSHDQLLTVAEVAERLRLHPITIRRHIKSGLLPAVRIGRAVRVRASDVEAFATPERSSGPKLPYRWPPTPEDIAERTKVMEETFARRDARAPLGISTTDLVREARRELGGWAERRAGRQLLTPAELARRKKLFEEARALRAKQPPLGMTTAELVHLARTARDWMYADDDDE